MFNNVPKRDHSRHVQQAKRQLLIIYVGTIYYYLAYKIVILSSISVIYSPF